MSWKIEIVKNIKSFHIDFHNIKKATFKYVNSYEFLQDFNNLKEIVFVSSNFDIIGETNESLNSLKSLERIEFNSSDNCTLNCWSPKLTSIMINRSSGITINGIINSVQKIEIIQSQNISLPFISFENKKVKIENVKSLKFMKDNQQFSPLEYRGINLERCEQLFDHQLDIPDYPIPDEHIDKNKFQMNRFVCYGDRNYVTIEKNVIKKAQEISERMYIPFLSKEFNSIKNTMNILTSNGIVEVSAYIRYYEITLKGFNEISIGLVTHFYNDYNDMIGWNWGTIACHSDDGRIYNGSGFGEEFIKPFGLSETAEQTFGCGFNMKKRTVFFTLNGKKIKKSFRFNEYKISAAFALGPFEHIEINYGDEIPFKFDLLKEYSENGYLK